MDHVFVEVLRSVEVLRDAWFCIKFQSYIVQTEIMQSIRREAPKIGGSFAVWGGLFSTFDCTLVALRKKGTQLLLSFTSST